MLYLPELARKTEFVSACWILDVREVGKQALLRAEDSVRSDVRVVRTTGHAASEVSRPLRHNGQPYTGINVLLLW
ncbi:hypothetical protein ACVIDN_006550 [Rhizobium brockwellii]